MISASSKFRNLCRENSNMLAKATLRLAGGSTRSLVQDDFMQGALAFDEGVSADGAFDVGAAIIGKFTFTLNNADGRFDDYDFAGATVTPYLGKEVSSGTVEWLQKGVYGVEQPSTYGPVIGVTAYDNMRLFERDYSDVPTSYPATLSKILRDVCTTCGVTLKNSSFPNYLHVVQARPADERLSCLDIVSYVAQLACCWAKCDNQGRLALGWYDLSAFDTQPAAGTYADISATASASVYTDDVVVTGVRVTAMSQVNADGTAGEDGETSLYGSSGYVLEVADNPLCLYGKAGECASAIGARVVGMRFRPFQATAVGDPSIEAGDPAVVVDASGNRHNSYITSLSYKAGGYETFACNAEYPGRNRATQYSAQTKAAAEARRLVKRETEARQQALENLADQLADSSGLFMTKATQQDGSDIYYMHDKPLLSESRVVWKLTANALGVSTDGGQTYPYGLDVNGDALLNRIYAVGINADYINAGSIEVSKNGNIRFLADYETGQVIIQDPNGNMWNTTTGELMMASSALFVDEDGTARPVTDIVGLAQGAAEAAAELRRAIVEVDVEYALSSSDKNPPGVDSTLWQTTCPARQDGKYIWTRMKVKNGEDDVSFSDPQMISGLDGQDGLPGPPGEDGKPSYTHIAYADNITLDGSMKPTAQKGFTTENAVAKRWLGVYCDENAADSTDYRKYTWKDTKGKDGENGISIKGDDGKSAYLHIAYADSQDGSEYFSTTVAKDRDYVGYCTDDKVPDPAKSTDGKDWPSKNLYVRPWEKYTWQNTAGLDGASPTSIVEQYTMTSSNTTKPGDNAQWSENQPQWEDGKYIWTRSKITWDRKSGGQWIVTYTSAVLAKAVNAANMNAWKALTAEIGGPNLLIDSNVPQLGKKAATHNRYFSVPAHSQFIDCKLLKSWTGYTLPIAGGSGAYAQFDIASNAGTRVRGLCFYQGGKVPMREGMKYTLSCMAYVASGDADILFEFGDTKYIGSSPTPLTRAWKRYSWTFTYSDAKSGGSGGSRVYFYAKAKNKAAMVRMCGFKLEEGERATAWNANPEDTKKSATDEAEEYVNAAFDNRGLGSSAVKALKEAVKQENLFKELCKNGNQFITSQNGKYYINAEWIKSGVLDAGFIRAGVIASKSAWDYWKTHEVWNANKKKRVHTFGTHSYWDMSTGYIQTNNLVARNSNVSGVITAGDGVERIMLKDGRLHGYYGKDSNGKYKHRGYINFAGAINNFSTNRVEYGLTLHGNQMIRIETPNLNVFQSVKVARQVFGSQYKASWKDPSVTGVSGAFCFSMSRMINGSIHYGFGALKFVNGICVGFEECGQPTSNGRVRKNTTALAVMYDY